jgi:hypothetical protein
LKLLKLWNARDVANQPKTKIRGFRIPDELYGAAQTKAIAEGRDVSEVVRELLTAWVTPEWGASGGVETRPIVGCMNTSTNPQMIIAAAAEAKAMTIAHEDSDEGFAVALIVGWVLAVAVSWFKSQPLDGGSWWLFFGLVGFFTFFVAVAWRDVRRMPR